MTIQQLKLFLAVSESLNYTHAAQQCYITRQALRQSIMALEQELGGPLFENHSNRITLTEKGKKLQHEAAPVMEAFHTLERSMASDYAAGRVIRLGVSLSLVPDYLPNLEEHLDAFRELYPRLELIRSEQFNDTLARDVRAGVLDCALVMDLRSGGEALERTELSAHPAAMLTAKHSSMEEKESLEPEDLGGQEICLPGMGEEFFPLLRCASLPGNVRFSVIASYYQVYYRVLEEHCIALNRLIPHEYRRGEPVRNLLLGGLPPLCSAFLMPKGETAREILALRDFLREKIQKDFLPFSKE